MVALVTVLRRGDWDVNLRPNGPSAWHVLSGRDVGAGIVMARTADGEPIAWTYSSDGGGWDTFPSAHLGV